jgi:hypothetical protein
MTWGYLQHSALLVQRCLHHSCHAAVSAICLIRKKKLLTHNAETFIDRICAYPFEKNKVLIAIVALFTVIAFFCIGEIEFEGDMTRMNYVPDKLQKAEENLNRINNYSLKSVFLVSSGKERWKKR